MDPIYSGDFQEPGPSLGAKVIEFIQTLVIFLAIGTAIYLFIAQPHRVSGQSMYPTLENGDYILTNKVGYTFGEPQRGQIIVFKEPRDESLDFIKRIVGIPSDRLKIQNGRVYLNGEVLKEAYLNPSVTTLPAAFLKEGQEVIIPEKRYIVVGDNRLASSDSREWGFITRDEIIGQTFFRYWPINSIGLILTRQE